MGKKIKTYKLPAHTSASRLREGMKNFQELRSYLIAEELEKIKLESGYYG